MTFLILDILFFAEIIIRMMSRVSDVVASVKQHRESARLWRWRYRQLVAGRISVGEARVWGWEIWPALAREHDRRANQLEATLGVRPREREVSTVVLRGVVPDLNSLCILDRPSR